MPPPSAVPPNALEEKSDADRNERAILTLTEVAKILRCSKAHVANVIHGNVKGLPRLAHLSIGRRKLVRREWLDQWMEANKIRC